MYITNVILASLTLLSSGLLYGQEIINLVPYSEQDWDYIEDNEDNVYLKDENYLLSKFEGKWIGSYEGQKYELSIEKLTDSGTDLGYKRDYLIMNYSIKSINNTTIADTFILDKANPTVPSGIGLFTLNDYRFAYSGFLSKCGQEGQLISRVEDPSEMTLFFQPSHILLNVAECPGGRAKQVFPVNGRVVLKRQ